MLTYKIIGKNIEVTDSIEKYIQDKLSILEKFSHKETEAKINVRVYSDKTAKIEATVPFETVLHAEDTAQDLYAAIDNVSEKLKKQARRLKTKKLNKHKNIATGKLFNQ